MLFHLTSTRPISAHSEDSDFGEEDTSKGRWSYLRNLIGAPKQSAKSKNSAAPKESSKPAAVPSNSTGDMSSADTTPAEIQQTQSHQSFSFRFSLEWVDKRFGSYQNWRLSPPRLPLPAQVHLQSKGINITPVHSSRPTGAAASSSRYAGRALAEWTFISHECQNFFDRRKKEGVPCDRLVETPTLAVEVFRRPG